MSMKVNLFGKLHRHALLWAMAALVLTVGLPDFRVTALEADVRRDATVEVVEKVMPSVTA